MTLSLSHRFDAAMARLPLVAILRGIRPEEAESIGSGLYEAGFRLIEVPLNSPDPFTSIASIRRVLPIDALVGAGTVLTSAQVMQVQATGSELIVMPHADVAVIAAAKTAGLICVPGITTPTEAFAALAAGADALKIFPAELVTPTVLKAMRAVLPRTLNLLPVGGITADTMPRWRDAGANGFGLGSALYQPGLDRGAVIQRAAAFVKAWAAMVAPA